MTLNFFMKNFIVTDSSLEKCVPIYQSLPTSDESFFKKTEKGFTDSFCTLVIKCETRSVPVTTRPDIPKLSEDSLFVLFLPVPNAFEEFAPSEIMSGNPFLLQQPSFNNSLRRYSGMICSRHPKRHKTLHSLCPYKNVLQRVIECMTEVKSTCDIWRWDHNRENITLLVRISMPVPVGVPKPLAASLGCPMIVVFW